MNIVLPIPFQVSFRVRFIGFRAAVENIIQKKNVFVLSKVVKKRNPLYNFQEELVENVENFEIL